MDKTATTIHGKNTTIGFIIPVILTVAFGIVAKEAKEGGTEVCISKRKGKVEVGPCPISIARHIY